MTHAHVAITFPKLVLHQGLERARPAASYFTGTDGTPHWEMYDFCAGMGSCYIFCHVYKHADSISVHSQCSIGQLDSCIQSFDQQILVEIGGGWYFPF